MTLAVIDFATERLRLLKLLLAIVQPVLLLALCVGFAVASVHLLTMLSTRWGNRRVSSKAMVFSIAVHLSLALGIVALIPEYRDRIWASLQDDKSPIEITTVSDVRFDESNGSTGAAALLRTLPNPVETTFERTDRLPDPFPVTASTVERPDIDTTLPEVAASSPSLPPVEVTPERQAATLAVLHEFATATLAESAAEAAARPESRVGTPDLVRSDVPAPVPEPVDTSRPPGGAIERLDDKPHPLAPPQSLQLDSEEQATIQRADNQEINRLSGAVAPPPALDPRLGADSSATARPSASSAGHPIARLGTASAPPGPSPDPAEVDRPRSSPTNSSLASAPQPPLEGPLAPRPVEGPSLVRIDGAAADGKVPALYQMRTDDHRDRAIQQYGGTLESKAAVDLSLRFLARSQESDGRWSVARWEGGAATRSPDNQTRDFTAADLDVGVTALATLAFLGNGNTLASGEYSENVRRAVAWLSSQQHSNGFLGREARDARTGTIPGNMSGMYGHGMATFAMAEAYAMSKDSADAPALRRRIERAIAFLLSAQLEDGGWRYFQYQTQGGDMSLFGWQVMALKSAQTGGIPIPPAVSERMVDFLKENGRGRSGGLGAYRKAERVTPAMTAEAFFCRQILGVGRDAPSSIEAVAYLTSPQNMPVRQRMDLYYWYYGTLSLFQYGDSEWTQWNARVRELLVSEQVHEGDTRGSWPPRDPWSVYGGRIYSTAIATLCLEVYYRYLPLYEQSAARPAPAEPAVAPPD